MKQNLRTFILGTIALVSLCLYFLSAKPLTPQLNLVEMPFLKVNEEEKNALVYLNQLRTNAGLIPFKRHKLLDLASKNHSNYLIEHHTFGHYEDANKSGFTGIFASERVLYVGYPSPQVIENVSSHNRNYQESINGLFAAIYHRLAFLDFRSDNIGIGIQQNPNNKSETHFVYDMSSSHLEKLYTKEKKGIQVTSKTLQKALSKYKNENQNIIIYPFNEQEGVLPAFFDELPDPLPTYDVSGYPISVSLNEAQYYKAKLLNFQLFNNQGKEVSDVLIYNAQTDPNRRLGKLDFVLFPLQRLEWNSRYSVKFSAVVDNKFIDKKWYFQTRKFNAPLHTVNNKDKIFTIKSNEKNIFYFPPSSKIDLLHDIVYPSYLTIQFIDKNTISLKATKRIKDTLHLAVGNHMLNINIIQ